MIDSRVTDALNSARERQALRDAIVDAKVRQRVVISQTVDSIPATPLPRIQAQSVQTQQAEAPGISPAPTPAPTPVITTPDEATTPLTEDQLAQIIDGFTPDVLSAVALITAALADRKLNVLEIMTLGTTLLGVVSRIVMEGAPQIKGISARILVILVFGVVYDRYLVPLMPVWLKPAASTIKVAVVKGLEALYKFVVKPSATADAR